MNDEERQQQMDFILESQSKFTAVFDKLKAADERAAQRMDRLEIIVNALLAAQLQNEERFAALAESQAHTDKKLNALIDIVREKSNGES